MNARTRAVTGMVALVLAVTAGCSSSGDATPATTATTTATTTAGAGGTRLADADVLQALALRDTDGPGGVTFSLIGGGDQVDGQVTLDVCGATFPSESLRTARYQQAGLGTDGAIVLSNESVLYGSSAGAEQAMDEVRTAAADCPDSFVAPVVQGQAPTKFRYEAVPDAELGPAAADHVALAGEAEDESGATASFVVVYQRRGRALVGIYGSDLASIKPYVGVAAQRLADLAPADAEPAT